ncbi:MAG: glycosyltransferase family 4 protein [Chloroflexota bacterium]|nr:glycosyltransferase family 4 protein [Chloroflexota bacterium]
MPHANVSLLRPARIAFVVEQTLGHVTHYRNLRAFAEGQSDVAPVWLPIPFDVNGPARFMPMVATNWSVRASLRARRALDATIAAGALDGVVFHTQVTSLFSRAIMLRVPTIVSLDATPVNYDSVGRYYGHRPAGDSFLDHQKYRLNHRALHSADGLVAWSEWTRRSLIDDYAVDPDRVRVLAPGAARSFFEIGDSRCAAAPVAEPSDPVRLLFVGGDFHRKGGPALLDWMRTSAAGQCELHLVTQAQLPWQPNVFVHNNLQANSPELQKLFAKADVFVLPSMADCLAVVLMEASAAGLPIITTDVGALSEAVRPGESGLLVPAGDSSALDAALTALTSDSQRRRRLGKASYALARQKFDAERNNRALLDLVLGVAQERFHSRRAA